MWVSLILSLLLCAGPECGAESYNGVWPLTLARNSNDTWSVKTTGGYYYTDVEDVWWHKGGRVLDGDCVLWLTRTIYDCWQRGRGWKVEVTY